MAGVDEHAERRRYYPDDESVPLSTAIYEAIEAHHEATLENDEFGLHEHVNPEAIDMLFTDTGDDDIEISVQFNPTNVTVAVWSDGGIDIRVSEKME
ncbi:hypothetical protein HALDL1_13045 [Halobacterium sp. DL1]|jgi:hypothetical protein|nr:hypothetical protein HALDL1_13045 [Halobacterium sp. DL1]